MGGERSRSDSVNDPDDWLVTGNAYNRVVLLTRGRGRGAPPPIGCYLGPTFKWVPHVKDGPCVSLEMQTVWSNWREPPWFACSGNVRDAVLPRGSVEPTHVFYVLLCE